MRARSLGGDMDTRYSDEQVALRDTAVRLARRLGPSAVPDLDDEDRRRRLVDAVTEAGWWWLRDSIDDGPHPMASGTEVGIVADAMAAAVADAPFLGPVLAGDLLRRAGVPSSDTRPTIGLTPDLLGLAVSGSGTGIVAFDAAGASSALVLIAAGEGWKLGTVELTESATGSDLTRRIGVVPASATVAEVEGQTRVLAADDLLAWSALGHASAAADLVGLMRGALQLAVDYAAEREQYGKPIGSFQAVQHLLADAKVLLEGSISCTLHAGWAVDTLPASEAWQAGVVAKVYAARAARTVCETVIQVHGGIGNTWECLAHVFLRRALQSTDLLGGDGALLQALAAERTGYRVGLS